MLFVPGLIARRGDRRRRQADRALRLHAAGVKRPNEDQDQGAKVERIGLWRRDRPLQEALVVGWLFAVVFHAVFLRETVVKGSANSRASAHASGRGGLVGTRNRAS